MFLDLSNSIVIPQNEKTNFTITNPKTWKYSILVEFNIKEEVDYLNLFFILKSYALNSELPPYSFYSSYSKDNMIFVTEREKISWLIIIDFFSFKDWLDYRLKNDSKYREENENFQGLMLTFPKHLIELYNKENKVENTLNYLKPIYPWSTLWLNNFKTSIDKIALLEKEIMFLKTTTKKT